MMAALRRILGIKSDREIVREVANEPTIKDARKAIKRADRILAELEAVGEKKP